MPANSLIIGVDLAPIRPIPRTITFQSDITKDTCRTAIRAHLKTWKAETILHDGAPNVGTAWVQDAFSQAELVLQALKLATELLDEGGTFVTKVFRSKDYNPLLWVFNQLFNKVEATKPPSSRNVSAEIFVVCRGFKAPKWLDPKLLDPRLVFAEISESAPDHEAKVFNPEKKKRKRSGYEDGEYTQFKELYAKDFIQTTDPISILASYSRLIFPYEGGPNVLSEAVSQSPITTAEIRQCCSDLKVLGRKEFRILLRWRLQLREKLGFAGSSSHTIAAAEDDELVDVTPLDDELQLQQELQLMSEAHNAHRKRDRRRENARKQREIIRMQMHMLAPHDIGLEQNGPNGEDQLFTISAIKRSGSDGLGPLDQKSLRTTTVSSKEAMNLGSGESGEEEQGEMDDDDIESENGDRLNAELDLMYVHYQARRADSTMKSRIERARQQQDEGWEGISEHGMSCSQRNSPDSEASNLGDCSERVYNDDYAEKEGPAALTKRASLFFDQEVFKDIIGGVSDSNHNNTPLTDERTTLLPEPNVCPYRIRQNTRYFPDPIIEGAHNTLDDDFSVATQSIPSNLYQHPPKDLQQASQHKKLIFNDRNHSDSPESYPSKSKVLICSHRIEY